MADSTDLSYGDMNIVFMQNIRHCTEQVSCVSYDSSISLIMNTHGVSQLRKLFTRYVLSNEKWILFTA